MSFVGSRVAALVLMLALPGCTNDPYPDEDRGTKVYYAPFEYPPRTLDPALARTPTDREIVGHVYDTLLEYHYLKRPYVLMGGLAESVPEPIVRDGGEIAYRFEIREDLVFQDDPCFALGGEGKTTREITSQDFAFELLRVADPAVNSLAAGAFASVRGFAEFSSKLGALRQSDPGFAALPVRRQYEQMGGIDGVRASDPHRLEIVLSQPNPQILYWFAMTFTSPLPWEALEYYDGKQGRPRLADHPVGCGPYVLDHYDPQSRVGLRKSPSYYGVRHPERKAPGCTYPSEGAPGDQEAGLLGPDAVGKPLPLIDRIELRREKERIPAFNKFLQGYYDAAGVVQESFDRIVQNGAISPDMASRGMRLVRSVLPTIYYLGFNMEDPVIGATGGERARKLRQAMSLTVDADEYLRLFLNGQAIAAQSVIPPGIFGHRDGYVNPYRVPDVDLARRRLDEAGYPGGIDPATSKPLHLTLDTGDTSTRARLHYQFFVHGWRKIGLDVEIAATSFNQFQQKLRQGAYQIYQWGWEADYPDPENFLFLLWSEMARTRSGGPNDTNFSDPRYDALFTRMKTRPNDAERQAMIEKMLDIVQEERPTIELFYLESYALVHGWFKNVKPAGLSIPTLKYRDVDEEARAESRARANRPVLWPVYLVLVLVALVVVPGVRTFFRERP